MNTRLLRRIQKHILKYPDAFVMEYFVENRDKETKTPCGTAACIGGWACIMEQKKLSPRLRQRLLNNISKPEDYWIGKDYDFNYFYHARRFLGISERQAESLFELGGWPEKFNIRYYGAKTNKGLARVAVQRIEHFINTGE